MLLCATTMLHFYHVMALMDLLSRPMCCGATGSHMTAGMSSSTCMGDLPKSSRRCTPLQILSASEYSLAARAQECGAHKRLLTLSMQQKGSLWRCAGILWRDTLQRVKWSSSAWARGLRDAPSLFRGSTFWLSRTLAGGAAGARAPSCSCSTTGTSSGVCIGPLPWLNSCQASCAAVSRLRSTPAAEVFGWVAVAPPCGASEQ